MTSTTETAHANPNAHGAVAGSSCFDPTHYHDTAERHRHMLRDEREAARHAEIAAAYYAGGVRAVIDAARARDDYAWGRAMTAYFGPTSIHESYLGQDGCPTLAARAKFPEIDRAMTEAHDRLRSYLRV